MTPTNWIQVASLVVDVIKTIIPFGILFLIFWLFSKEIKSLIRNGGLKVAAPGFSLETIQKQQEKLSKKEKIGIESLNKELETSRQSEKRLQELQQYTARDKDTFFIGYHLEKTYRLIFPSQMLILNAMKNNNGEITEALALAIFNRTIWAQQFNATFQQFMDFMVQSGLIVYDSSKFMITPLGKTFMEYLENNNIPLKIPASDMILPSTTPAPTV